jgi:competence protein ComEC
MRNGKITLLIELMIIILLGVAILLYIIKKPLNMVIIILFFSMGIFQYNDYYLREGFEDKFQNQEVIIEADVLELERYEDRVVILFKGKSLKHENNIITVNFKGDCVVFTSKHLDVYHGDAILVEGVVMPRPILRDRDLYDSRLVQREKGIDISLKTNQDSIEAVGSNSTFIYYALKNRTTLAMKKIIGKLFEGRIYQFALATLLGLKDELVDLDRSIFDKSGVSHILVVSGLHVAMVTSWIGYILCKIIRNKWINILILGGFLLLYCILTGFSPSTLRASILVFCYLMAKNLGTRYNTLSTLSFAALIMLMINPLTLFLPSFQLSFGAVLGIYFLNNMILRNVVGVYRPLASIISITLSVQLFTLPIVLYHFNTISILSLISNILILPLFTLAMILLMISILVSLVTLGGAYFFVKFYNIVVIIIIYISSTIGNLPFSQINFISPHPLAILTYYLTLLLGLNKNKRKIKIAAAMTVIGITILMQIYNPFLLKAYFIDVGQGDCALVRLVGGTNILIDTGQQKYAQRTIIPYLRKKGVNKIDYLLISHDHDDHSGGVIDIMNNMKVGKVLIGQNNFTHEEYQTLISSLQTMKKQILYLEGGDVIRSGKSSLDIIHPSREFLVDNTDANEGSLVAKMNYREISFLFTGDIGFRAEQDIIRNGYNIKSDILKVAHHGSNYSSSHEFIEKTSAQISIIQVGTNRYGHPGKEALARIKQPGGTVLTTLDNGTITIISNGKRIWIRTGYDSKT